MPGATVLLILPHRRPVLDTGLGYLWGTSDAKGVSKRLCEQQAKPRIKSGATGRRGCLARLFAASCCSGHENIADISHYACKQQWPCERLHRAKDHQMVL